MTQPKPAVASTTVSTATDSTAVTSLDPERLPVLQGVTSSVPDAALEQIAAKVNVPVSKLSRLTVAREARELWLAITDYVSHSPVPKDHSTVPLHVRSCRRDKDDDVQSDMHMMHSMPHNRRMLALLMANASEKVMDTGPRPVFELSTSGVEFLWPPPRHLEAERLIEMRNADPTVNLHEILMPGHRTEDEEDDDNTIRHSLHLLLYTVGEPQASDCGGMDMYNEMMLVSERGSLALVQFTSEVLTWHHQQKKAPDLRSRFPLFRFKMEREHGTWEAEGLKRARPVESVVLVENQMKMILKDVENFTSVPTRNWYFRHGLPYRRSYLFYGPPGTGKTSTVRVLASKFSLSCCFLSIANRRFSNQALGDAFSNMPPNALLVLEDVDALFNEDRSNKVDNEVTFSGLLNALDGLVSVEGMITVMTTNHIERLEKALIRGGRVDRRFKFSLPDDKQLMKLFRSFYPDSEDGTVEMFVKKVRSRYEGDEASSVSTLQQLFIDMREKTDKECVEGIEEFYDLHFPKGDVVNGLSYTT